MSESLKTDLLRPGAYPFPVGEIEMVETHISWLFFAGDRVYKVKKPVRLEFLDYSTVDRREHFCREELRLNRRLAPETYLRVVSVTRDRDGRLHVDGDGEIADWAVEMALLPADRMLDRMLGRGEIDNRAIDEVAALLADFHAEAESGDSVARYGSPQAVRSLVTDNLTELRELVDAPGDPPLGLLDFLEERAAGFLGDHTALFERRVLAERIRDGHGDLHAGNLCFTANGVVAYDCIEFSERFRCGDQALDLAFLAMDLDFRGFRAFSSYLVRRYGELAHDPELGRLMPFYKAYRATVRAKVHRLAAEDPEQRSAEIETANGYLHLAADYALPPCLVLTCGLPASGKSWAAKALSRRWGAAWLRSDVRRKALAGVPRTPAEGGSPTDTDDLYSEEMTRRTYDSLLEKARRALESGRSVVVDATFSSRRLRRPFLELATRLGVPCYVLQLTAAEPESRRRLAARADEPDEPSDADLRVYLELRERFEPPVEVDARHLAVLDTESARPADAVAEITALRIADARHEPASG